MQICSDPLGAVRSVGSDQQWCVTLPACYPTIIPYIPNNIECNDQKASDTRPISSDVNNYDCTNIENSALCANSQLIQRIRRKIDLYQISPSNDACQIHQDLTNIVKQHVSDGDVRKRVSQRNQLQSSVQQDVSPTSSSVASKSRSPSLLQQVVDRKIIDERVSSKDSSHQSHSSDSSLHSTDLSNDSDQTNDSSSQFSPTESAQSLSTDNENNSDQIDSKSSTVFDSSPSDSNDRVSTTISTPVSSIFSTPHLSKHQVISDQLHQTVPNMMATSSHSNEHPLSDDHIMSAIDLKSSSSLSPSHNQQRIDSVLSSKQTTPAIQSPTSSTSNFGQQESSIQSWRSPYSHRSPSIKSQYSNKTQHTQVKSNENIDQNERKKDYQHQFPKETRDNKISSWFEKLKEKISSKYLNATSFHDSSPENISHIYTNNQESLNMKEAMAALEQDLTKEAFQALINKKKESQQNRLMYILTTPSRCCRSCRTQRRLATVTQRSIDIAIKNYTDTSN